MQLENKKITRIVSTRVIGKIAGNAAKRRVVNLLSNNRLFRVIGERFAEVAAHHGGEDRE